MNKHFVPNVNIENATILPAYKNFSGEKFNDGKRGFTWVIDDPGFANVLKRDGWRVKVVVRDPAMVQPLIDDGWKSVNVYPELKNDVEYRLDVAVNFNPPVGVAPAEIYTHKGSVTNRINEITAAELDALTFVKVDMTITPSWWRESDGDWSIKAYTRVMHITLEDDPWKEKYGEYTGE